MKNILKTTLMLLVVTAFAYTSHAESFTKKHPRRAEVNKRERNQQKRIRQGVKNGKLTPAQAQQLEGQEKAIKQQERADVKANGGYLTKDQQKQLNQEENQASKEIHQDKHPTAPETTPQ